VDSGRFLGTFHVHPPDRPPFYDPGDLATMLRSDSAGFIELLLARDRLYAAVRANPYLYISAHHVNRNPLLLAEEHAARVRRLGSRAPEDPDYAEHYRRAGLYYFQRYQVALYEGDPRAPLRRTSPPKEPGNPSLRPAPPPQWSPRPPQRGSTRLRIHPTPGQASPVSPGGSALPAPVQLGPVPPRESDGT
jgi:hypothetical protein